MIKGSENYLSTTLLELELIEAFKSGFSSYFFEVDAKNSGISNFGILFKSERIGRLAGLFISQPKKDFYMFVLTKIPVYLRSNKDYESDTHGLYDLLSRKLIKKNCSCLS